MEQQRLRPARSSITIPPLNEKKAITNESLPQINNNNNISNNNDDTQNYLEDMKKGTYNILVCVRCRPLSQLELQISNYETIKIMEKKIVVLMDPIEYNGPNSIFKNRSREQTYAFDFAFDKYTTQKTVFENSTKFLLEGVVNGFNSTVFAYGATGAGKTYTMLGNDNNPGIMPMTLIELFNQVNKYSDREYKLKLWYLEIYNENIRDLLKFTNPNNTNDEYLDLREDPTKGIIVNNITELNVTSSEDILKILKKGNRNRTQESTGANETSSRSHAILQINIEYYEKNQGINVEIKYSKLSLIDLAGSERASATQNRGIRLIEGANINRSL
jgi:kinesin family protein 18/19